MKILRLIPVTVIVFFLFSSSTYGRTLTTDNRSSVAASDSTKIIVKALIEEINAIDKKKKKTTPIPPDRKKKKKKDIQPQPPDKKEKRKNKKQSTEDLFNNKFNKSVKGFENHFQKTEEKFEIKYKVTLERWRKARKSYIKRLENYQKALVDEKTLVPSESIKKIKLSQVSNSSNEQILNNRNKRYHIIPGALDIPIRDQGKRGTCASFTAIRAIESVLAQHDLNDNLSEQYFYWLSKPKCQKVVCSNGGAWFGYGLINSKSAMVIDITTEKNCPYNPQPVKANETQIPLRPECSVGAAKTIEFGMVPKTNLLQELSNNRPILSAFKLSPNFYRSQGLITQSEATVKGKTDAHAAGHAILIVGFIKLPESFYKSEGKICYITANSWSEGWGKGGYGCLTEKWVNKHSLAFMSLHSVIVN